MFRLADYSMGRARSYETYMRMVGLDTATKTTSPNQWCRNGQWPEEAKPYYYEGADKYSTLPM